MEHIKTLVREMPKSKLEDLRKLSKDLFTEDFEVSDFKSLFFKEYEMEKGTCYGWHIRKLGSILSIDRWYNSKDSIFPRHCHKDSKEMFIVYNGKIVFLFDDGTTKTINKSEMYYVDANKYHKSYFPEETEYITITIPPASNFPHEDANGH